MSKSRFSASRLVVLGATALVLGATVVAYLWPLRRSVGSATPYACHRCGSTKLGRGTDHSLGRMGKMIYRSPAFGDCPHQWLKGWPTAHAKPVSNDVIVLVRQNKEYGAFVLREQHSDPESCEFSWWYCKGGDATFVGCSNVTAGTDVAVRKPRGVLAHVAFGKFRIGWSLHGTGSGWLYFEGTPGSVGETGLSICVTGLRSLDGVDGSDSKWDYKGFWTPTQ